MFKSINFYFPEITKKPNFTFSIFIWITISNVIKSSFTVFYFKIVLSSHGHLWIHIKTISTTLTTLNELVCIIRTHDAFLSTQRTVRPCTRLGCMSFSTWPREQRFESNPLSWRQDAKWPHWRNISLSVSSAHPRSNIQRTHGPPFIEFLG